MVKIGARGTQRKRRAVAGLVAALILFVMLFTVGTGYFLWVNTNNGLYSQALAARAAAVQNQVLENLQIITERGGAGGNDILFTVTNQGGLAAIIMSVFVSDNAGTLYCTVAGSPCTLVTITPVLPFGVSQGITTSTIDSGVSIPAGFTGTPPFTVKIVTQRGNSFTQQYPMPVAPFAVNAGSSNSAPIGFISMNFNYFKAYSVVCTSGDPSSPPVGGCTVTGFDTASPFSGYSVTKSILTGNYMLLVLSLTNVDPNLRDIVLSPGTPGSVSPSGTVDVQFAAPSKGGGTTSAAPFILGAVCNVPAGCGSYPYGHTMPPASLTLPRCTASGTPPNQILTCTPTLVYFYTTTKVAANFPFSNANPVPVVASNLIYLSGTVSAGGGCVPPPLPAPQTCPYGQSIPFATTLWSA